MNDLYALSLIIKNHPSYKILAEGLQHLYRRLGLSDSLSADVLLQELRQEFPELHKDIQNSHQAFKEHCQSISVQQQLGIQFICYGEAHYPEGCYWMNDPPLTLSYLGEVSWSSRRALAVVGSREPCFESTQWMERELLQFCEDAEPVIVSGGARGVDQKAHSVAIRKSLSTVVVLPSGLKSLYPENLLEWVDDIRDRGGCLLSEYGYEQKMHKYLFHHRNRLIAALGKATLLVEARRRSGTLITAQQAIQLGRPVWVVPGHPHDPHFGGSLDLLSEGALLVRDSQDLKMYFSDHGGQT